MQKTFNILDNLLNNSIINKNELSKKGKINVIKDKG